MTKQKEVLDNPKYISTLDHGFVGLVDSMGSDGDIVAAARVSYGDGTKNIRADRGLIRYLMSHRHTSPFEMCEIKLHLKMPIFVMRQWVRHRTASLNEYSGRYSVMSDEFYVPGMEMIAPQATDNKQGRSGVMSDKNKHGVQDLMEAAFDTSYSLYECLYKTAEEQGDHGKLDAPFGAYDDDDGWLDGEYPGTAREIARNVLPVANYTELYWKQNLHNMFHLIKLRVDPHAQAEIRAYAQAVYDLIKPLFPIAVEAFEDYVLEGATISKMDLHLLRTLLASPTVPLDAMIASSGSSTIFADSIGMTARELSAFKSRFSV